MSRCARYCGQDGAGGYNAPGVPNITGKGSIAGYTLADVDSSGAFYNVIIDNDEKKWLKKEPNDSHKLATLSMSAARMGSVYGKSDTVMPASIETPVALYLGSFAQV